MAAPARPCSDGVNSQGGVVVGCCCRHDVPSQIHVEQVPVNACPELVRSEASMTVALVAGSSLICQAWRLHGGVPGGLFTLTARWVQFTPSQVNVSSTFWSSMPPYAPSK